MRKKIGELLVEAGAVTEEQVQKALSYQKRPVHGRSRRLGEVLVTLGFTTPWSVAQALARQYELPFAELPRIPPVVCSLVPVEFQARHRLVPFRLEPEGRSERLHVAVDDPTNFSRVDELRMRLRRNILVHVVTPDDLDRALAAQGRPVSPEFEEATPLDDDADLVIERSQTRLPSRDSLGPAAQQEDLDPLDVQEVSGLPGRPLLPPPSAAGRQAPSAALAAPPRSFTPTQLQALRPPPRPSPPPPPEALGEDELDMEEEFGDPSDELVDEAEDLFEGALGESEPEPDSEPEPERRRPPSSKSRVPVVVFGGAAQSVKPPDPPAALDFSEEDLQVLEDLERMAQGDAALLNSEKVKPTRMVASLIRLLIRKQVISEQEFLEELSRR